MKSAVPHAQAISVGLLLLVALGCEPDGAGEEADEPAPTCGIAGARELCRTGETFSCAWSHLVDSALTRKLLLNYVDAAPASSLDEALVALFNLEDVELVDETPPPASFTFSYPAFPDYKVSIPIDWRADPYENPTWRVRFTGLDLLPKLDPEVAAGVVISFAEHALSGMETPITLWYDQAISVRSARLREFLGKYLDGRTRISRRLLVASARLLLSHIYAMASSGCYRAENNHGLMLDNELAAAALSFPRLSQSAVLAGFASRRFTSSLSLATTSDGVHRENSPSYHRFAVELAQNMVSQFDSQTLGPPQELIQLRDRLLEAMIYLLQPNRTAVQFGDSDNSTRGPSTTALFRRLRASESTDPKLLGMFDFAWSRGKSGTKPETPHRVFGIGGYASFRSGWTEESVVGHFACTRQLATHKQRDATGIEIYGFGTELILNPGVFGYTADPLAAYQSSASAHNILVVDEYDEYALSGPRPLITEFSEDTNAPWVVGCHQNYRDLGVPTVARLFAFSPPDTFVLVDQAISEGEHQYDQHLHMLPRMSQVDYTSDKSLVVRNPSMDSFASVVIATGAAGERILQRGASDDASRAGWYFPSTYIAEPSTDIVFRFFRKGTAEFPMVIRVVGPKETRPRITNVTWSRNAKGSRVKWFEDSRSREVTFPALKLADNPTCREPTLGNENDSVRRGEPRHLH